MTSSFSFFHQKKEATLRGRTVLKMHSSQTLSPYDKLLKEGNKQLKKYTPIKVIGRGTYGVVSLARNSSGDMVAIKKIREDPTTKNREVEIMELLKNCPNIVSIHTSFKTSFRSPLDAYLHIVMDYLPSNIHDYVLTYRKRKDIFPPIYIKLFAYQIFYGLHQIHKKSIVHRDIKPQNLLLNEETCELKICDFGSAKKLVADENNTSYIQSRYYRAPELIYGCQNYTTSIDIWSAGCVIAEMILVGRPLFMGETSVGQIFEIAKIIGSPTSDDLMSFPHHLIINLPEMKEVELKSVFPAHAPKDLISLLEEIFVYAPKLRPSASECLNHECFDEIFETEEDGSPKKLPNGKPFPKLTRSVA